MTLPASPSIAVEERRRPAVEGERPGDAQRLAGARRRPRSPSSLGSAEAHDRRRPRRARPAGRDVDDAVTGQQHAARDRASAATARSRPPATPGLPSTSPSSIEHRVAADDARGVPARPAGDATGPRLELARAIARPARRASAAVTPSSSTPLTTTRGVEPGVAQQPQPRRRRGGEDERAGVHERPCWHDPGSPVASRNCERHPGRQGSRRRPRRPGALHRPRPGRRARRRDRAGRGQRRGQVDAAAHPRRASSRPSTGTVRAHARPPRPSATCRRSRTAAPGETVRDFLARRTGVAAAQPRRWTRRPRR